VPKRLKSKGGRCSTPSVAVHYRCRGHRWDYAVAQALLRHRDMTTTLRVYKKAMTSAAFQKGMKQLEAAGKK
jgi:integrase